MRIHSHKVNHLNTRPRITQPLVTPSVRHLIQTTSRTKIETQSSAYRVTPSISPAHQKEKKKKKISTNLSQCKAYTNPWTKLRSAETKRRKEQKFEGWEKETSNTIRCFFKKEKWQRNASQIEEQTGNTEI